MGSVPRDARLSWCFGRRVDALTHGSEHRTLVSLLFQLVAQCVNNTNLAPSGTESLDRCHRGGRKQMECKYALHPPKAW